MSLTVFTVADGIRVGDDLARFHLQNTIFKRPIFGVHGSFLMTNGEMENECTWDFGYVGWLSSVVTAEAWT